MPLANSTGVWGTKDILAGNEEFIQYLFAFPANQNSLLDTKRECLAGLREISVVPERFAASIPEMSCTKQSGALFLSSSSSLFYSEASPAVLSEVYSRVSVLQIAAFACYPLLLTRRVHFCRSHSEGLAETIRSPSSEAPRDNRRD